MRILVTFAIEQEFAPWRRLRPFRRVSAALYEVTVGEHIVRVRLTGMGPENARRAMRLVLDHVPEVCISSGLAGALKPAYRLGKILAARQVADLKDGRVAESSPALVALASDCGAQVVDLFLTADRILASSSEKRRLGEFADAVEMESEAVLDEMMRWWAVPVLAVRAVGDVAEEDLPPYDFSRDVDVRGRIRALAMLGQILHRPRGLPALIRLGRRSRIASVSLARFLDQFVATLASPILAGERESPVAAT